MLAASAGEPFSVTVVIPAYNESGRIGTAIAAIRAQTEAPSEIIVIDDGSKDDTADVARALGVTVIVQQNAGIAAARNNGIRSSTTSWIALCDADDLWYPEFLACIRLAHEARPDASFIFTDHCTEIGGVIMQPSMFAANEEYRAAGGVSVAPHVAFFEGKHLAHALARSNFIAPSTVAVRRSLMVERSIFFEPDLPSSKDYHVAEDIEWYLRVLAVSDGLGIDRPLMQYHRHDASVSANVGRVTYGLCKLGERVIANPAAYAEGLGEAYAGLRRRHVRQAATDHLRTFRFVDALARLREAQRIEYRVSDEGLVLMARLLALPGGVTLARGARDLWRTKIKPALKGGSRA